MPALNEIKIKNEKNDDESFDLIAIWNGNDGENYVIESVNGDESYESFDLITIWNGNDGENYVIEIEIDTACGIDTRYDVYRRCFDDAQQRADLKK